MAADSTRPGQLHELGVILLAARLHQLSPTIKNEPEWMLEWRLKAFRQWLKMEEPHHWANLSYPKINYQDIIYYSAPKQKEKPKSLDEIDPELRRTFEKLGISLDEQKRLSGVAVDAVIDSVSIATTFKEQLAEKGIIFCSISEAIQEHFQWPKLCVRIRECSGGWKKGNLDDTGG